jgi:hypothetical protein
MRLCILVFAACTLTSLVVADPLWVRTYNGPDSTYDEVHAIGVDDSGCVIVSGYSSVSGNDEEFVTIKYRPDGDTAWLRHFNAGSGLDGATALAVDRSGNVIVTGYGGGASSQYGDWVTIKYSASGESLWAAVYDLGDQDRPSSIVADSAGSSYVTGKAGSLNYLDMSVVKYGPGGDEVWVFSYDGGDNDMANAVTVDGQGNTYLTGYTIRSGNYGDLMTWKLGLGGESLWANTYGSPVDQHDCGWAVAADGAGGAVVAGVSDDSAGHEDYLTIRYGPTGETLWTRRYNGPGNRTDFVMGLALDAAGNAYVTGMSYADAQDYNYATIKYGPDGRQCWVARYSGPRDRDRAAAIALDDEANVYVTGSSLSASNSWDVVTIKYDSAGNQQWLERFDMPSTFDEGYVIAVSRQGMAFVGGRTDFDDTGIDYLTLAYGAAGAVEETPNAEVRAPNRGATIVRGVLRVSLQSTANGSQPGTRLYDANGRRVPDLHE